VRERRQLRADVLEVRAVELGGNHGWLVRGLRDDQPPWIRDQRSPVRRLAGQRLADLRGGGDVALVLDRTRAHEDVPVVLTGRCREMRRNGYQLGSFERKDAIQLREADVVADGQPDAPVLDAHDDGLVTGFLRLRLAVRDAADLDVEQVDLPVGRDDRSVCIEDDGCVRELLASFPTLRDRAAYERHAVPP